MIKSLVSVLNYDNIRSKIDKVSIPFNNKELSERFISEHVQSVRVDNRENKIVVTLKAKADSEDADLIIPDFIKNLGEIVNQEKVAIKYAVSKTKPIKIEFILVQKLKSSTGINMEQLADMKERYNLSDDFYKALVKLSIVGN
jgi:hypothetical protein